MEVLFISFLIFIHLKHSFCRNKSQKNFLCSLKSSSSFCYFVAVSCFFIVTTVSSMLSSLPSAFLIFCYISFPFTFIHKICLHSCELSFISLHFCYFTMCFCVQKLQIQYIILDFSALSYIDPSGVTALKLLNEVFNKVDITIYLAGISGIFSLYRVWYWKCLNLSRIKNIRNYRIQYEIITFQHKHETKSRLQNILNFNRLKNCHVQQSLAQNSSG